MAESNQIARVSDKHEHMLNWMIANPTANRTEMAAQFGVTRAWLSTVIHSDVFQAKLTLKQGRVENAVVAGIEDKLLGAAHMAAERMMELIPLESELKNVSGSMDTALKNLGYGQRSAMHLHADGDVNVIQASTSAVNKARELVGKAQQATEVEPLDIEYSKLEGNDLKELPAPDGRQVGEDSTPPALPGTQSFAES